MLWTKDKFILFTVEFWQQVTKKQKINKELSFLHILMVDLKTYFTFLLWPQIIFFFHLTPNVSPTQPNAITLKEAEKKYMHTRTHTHTYTYTRTHTRTYIHTHTHTHTNNVLPKRFR